ncbi:MAG: FHA domain-containing protein [Candidatus Aureabacteria bacterium]|nr:FHA domain-containing protein [Candidatus Auribacterota bacterium]
MNTQINFKETDLQNQPDNNASEKKYYLTVSNKSKNVEMRYALEEGKELTIGADTECPVSVNDDYISSNHFSLTLKGDKAEVKDLGSKNGSYLLLDNNTIELSPDQTLLAGKTFFKLEIAEDEKE